MSSRRRKPPKNRQTPQPRGRVEGWPTIADSPRHAATIAAKAYRRRSEPGFTVDDLEAELVAKAHEVTSAGTVVGCDHLRITGRSFWTPSLPNALLCVRCLPTVPVPMSCDRCGMRPPKHRWATTPGNTTLIALVCDPCSFTAPAATAPPSSSPDHDGSVEP